MSETTFTLNRGRSGRPSRFLIPRVRGYTVLRQFRIYATRHQNVCMLNLTELARSERWRSTHPGQVKVKNTVGALNETQMS